MYGNSGIKQYQQTDICSMSKEKMIVLLYEKIVSDLNEALAAIDSGDRVAMTKRTNHSQRIVSELRNSLDHSIGGDISRNLESLYDYMFHQQGQELLGLGQGNTQTRADVLGLGWFERVLLE